MTIEHQKNTSNFVQYEKQILLLTKLHTNHLKTKYFL